MDEILITGASGYIGGRLAQHFIDAGVDVRLVGPKAVKPFGRERKNVSNMDVRHPERRWTLLGV